MTVRDACLGCGSNQIKKNGHIHNGKQNHRCKACGRQFVVLANNRVIAEEHRTLVARLLREKLSLHGICRAVGVGMKWLMRFMVTCFNAAPEHLHVQLPGAPKAVMLRRLEAEADEMCSFVSKKINKQWLWLAMDTSTRQILAFHVGDRSRNSAEHLWAKIPVAYREQARFYTDRDEAYTGVLPATQHKAITKLARKTNSIECFNNTLRQRVSRLVRDALAQPEKRQNGEDDHDHADDVDDVVHEHPLRVDLLRLHVQTHPVGGLLTGTHPRIPDDLHVDSLLYDPR